MSSFQEPRIQQRQRVEQVPQVDVARSGAAEQMVLTVHVDLTNGAGARAETPVGFKRAIAAAVQGVVNELMPFVPAQSSPLPESRAGAPRQVDVADVPSVTQVGQVDQKTSEEVKAPVAEA